VIGGAVALAARALVSESAPAYVINCSLMGGAFMLNVVTDVIAVLTMLAQMEEEILTDVTIVYVYGSILVIGLIPALARVKIQVYGFMLGLKKTSKDPIMYYFIIIDMVACMMGGFFDAITLIIQGYTVYISPSISIIVSMLMTSMSVAYAMGCPTILGFALRLLKVHDTSTGDRMTTVKFSWNKLILKIINPFAINMKPTDELAVAIHAFKQGDEKSQ